MSYSRAWRRAVERDDSRDEYRARDRYVTGEPINGDNCHKCGRHLEGPYKRWVTLSTGRMVCECLPGLICEAQPLPQREKGPEWLPR